MKLTIVFVAAVLALVLMLTVRVLRFILAPAPKYIEPVSVKDTIPTPNTAPTLAERRAQAERMSQEEADDDDPTDESNSDLLADTEFD